MKKVSKGQKKGFTLVELIVVIGILGVLAAIILPKFTGYTEKAIMKELVSYGRTLYTYLNSYYAEHGEYPTVGDKGHTFTSTNKLLKAAGVPSEVLMYPSEYSGKTGTFIIRLKRGNKSYVVKYDENGVIKEIPPS